MVFPKTRRVWFDINIGTDPSCALGLLFASRHPEIEIVGVSVSGKNQSKRVEEAYRILEYAKCDDVDVYYGDDITRSKFDEAQASNVLVSGPLTNISRLLLEEAHFEKLHIVGGAFRRVYYRGQQISTDSALTNDLDSTRVVLSQADEVVLSTIEATSALMIDNQALESIQEKHPILKPRFAGYQDYLSTKYGDGFEYLIAKEVLAICDVLDVPTITREIVEFEIQPDGSFFSSNILENNPDPIEKISDNPDGIPVPRVKHQAIRTVNTMRILQELEKFI